MNIFYPVWNGYIQSRINLAAAIETKILDLSCITGKSIENIHNALEVKCSEGHFSIDVLGNWIERGLSGIDIMEI